MTLLPGIRPLLTRLIPRSVTTSVTLAESRTKLYRALRDESQFMHQLKSDVLFSECLPCGKPVVTPLTK